MSSGRSPMTVFLAVTGGVILTGLILFAPWWVWVPLTGAIAVFLLVRTVMSDRASRRLPLFDPDPPYDPSPPPVERRQEPITNVQLPSECPDYCFLFSATVVWSPRQNVMVETTANMAALAVDDVLRRAREITEKRDPREVSLVRYELGGVLARMQADRGGCLEAMAESVDLVLPEEDRHRLEELATVRKKKDVWEHGRKFEQSKREYLSQDVLKDPGSAVVWHLARNDDQVEKTVNDIGLLAKLSSAANNHEIPETFMRYVPEFGSAPSDDHIFGNGHSPNGYGPQDDEKTGADHFEAFVRAEFPEDGQDRRLLVKRMALAIAKQDRHDLANDILRRFDPPDDAQDQWDADQEG
ncbi:hypothetical protein Sme01_55360 [Sphaerisporangium melleum]|uniref:Uncharacterized protein n=1 Tax=Sphaerisporangium melleum TaxID=321316 RepID=A0A917VW80_9ACTN|nr:hypothetical protein [Sphaerisporangium melleum]GGL20524.1 hypothetical protein GCM10007964_73070 [Sphaerisporangium melleum]GII73060.1 hypothetical protein Sme01_55360 [Sphaerisporangium melleum]